MVRPRNLPKGRPGVPRRPRRPVYFAQAPAPTLFGMLSAVIRPLTIYSHDETIREQIDRGRMIGMADQQMRTIARENDQARYCNGVIMHPDRNQYL